LAKAMDTTIYDIEFPIKEDRQGNQLTDVNDFYKAGYDSKVKWDKLLGSCKEIVIP